MDQDSHDFGSNEDRNLATTGVNIQAPCRMKQGGGSTLDPKGKREGIRKLSRKRRQGKILDYGGGQCMLFITAALTFMASSFGTHDNLKQAFIPIVEGSSAADVVTPTSKSATIHAKIGNVAIDGEGGLDVTDNGKELQHYSHNQYHEAQSKCNGPDDVIVVTTVDGVFHGISKRTGERIWKSNGWTSTETDGSTDSTTSKQSNSNLSQGPSQTGNHRMRPHFGKEAPGTLGTVFAPLLSTSTTRSSKNWNMEAIPFLDGSVQLKLGKNNQNHNIDDEFEPFTTTVKDLVSKAPFLDPRGGFYMGSQQSTAIAFDQLTGEVLRIISADGGLSNAGIDTTFDEARSVIWAGRVDYSVKVFDTRTGAMEVEFSSSEILSLDDMVSIEHPPQSVNESNEGQESKYGSTLTLPSGGEASSHEISENTRLESGHLSPSLVTTPRGNLAMRDSDEVLWISNDTFDAPIAFALESHSGLSLGVDIVQDAPKEFSKKYLFELDEDDKMNSYDGNLVIAPMKNSGELFAISLGGLRSNDARKGLPHIPRISSTIGSTKSGGNKIPQISLGNSLDISQRKKNHIPNTLESYSIEQYEDTFIPDHSGRESERDNENSRFKTFVLVMTSWIPPAVALAFVISFEFGRRERLRVELERRRLLDENETQITASLGSLPSQIPTFAEENRIERQVGVIQVSEEVLGYGGHGTVVYKGKLDGRFVAVKRMLKAYHASADREISLLIESDGHPNVVRYFLKETRGDFVYLALELCDISLQDLIVALAKQRSRLSLEKSDFFSPFFSKMILQAMKTTLYYISLGVKHIHSLRIVHRDLKPQNILLATNKKNREDANDNIEDIVFNTFQAGDYLPKISDMGLGKQLTGQSSFGLSTLNNSVGIGGNDGSTIAGAGPGSVGWQAPEVMAQRLAADPSFYSGGSGNGSQTLSEASPMGPSGNRTSRSVDIFSLGCIFYCTLIPGSHPFGDWYEREANIMKNRPLVDGLKEISADASELILSMINRNPKARPTASQVCNHPFFWNPSKRLSFLCDLSDRLEADTNDGDQDMHEQYTPDFDTLYIEKGASDIVGTTWDTKLDQGLFNNVTKFRSYDQSSVRDCLRLIRNKHHHYDELPRDVKESIAPNQDALMEYFESKFPLLLMHCYNICRNHLQKTDILLTKYDIPSKRQSNVTVPFNVKSSSGKKEDSEENENDKISPIKVLYNEISQNESISEGHKQNVAMINAAKYASKETPVLMSEVSSLSAGTGDNILIMSSPKIVIWEKSNAASSLGCRGWMRSEEEWTRRIDLKIKKRDPDLMHCAQDDPKYYRTRLCNHWDVNKGTFCPMRKKHKCIFAHGPIELRVKEGKRNRWGKLVDKNGNSSNSLHSGGEDT